jgi:hypothetical protein
VLQGNFQPANPARTRSKLVFASFFRPTIHTMPTLTTLAKFNIPVGLQVIELQQVEYEGANMRQLRTRIREKSRFTVFDIDPQSARLWGEALLRWADEQPDHQMAPEATE